MSKRTVLVLLAGLYLLLNGGLLLASPRWFVRIHTLPFYPPSFKRGMETIAAHAGPSRAVGLMATLAGSACLLRVRPRRTR